MLLLIGNVLFAQGPQIVLDIKLTNENTSKKLAGVSVEIYQDGAKISTSITSSKGVVNEIIVPVDHVYKIKFKKDGFVTKMILIDGRFDTPEDLDDETYYNIPGSLFESVEGVDFSFLENEPMLKMEFTADGYEFVWDESHYKVMKKKITDLKKKIAKEKAEQEKKEEENIKREADFQTYVDAGDKAISNSDYQTAVNQFNLALKLVDKPEVQTKLVNAQKLLAEAEASAQKEKNYIAKLTEAKTAFDSKGYDNALKLYKDAQAIKPAEKEPGNQILIIKDILVKQKLEEVEFNELVSKGDAAVSSKNFDVAIENYTKALDLNPNDVSVKTKLDNARKSKDEKENAVRVEKEKEANYQALMSSAELLFQKDDWQAAKDKYNAALVIKPNETKPINQIKVIDDKIASLKADEDKLKQLQEKYLTKLSEANSAFTSNDYDKALSLYNEAKVLKPNEDEPQVQINKIKDIKKLQVANDAEFIALEKQGDVALAGELFDDAIVFFEKALKIKASTIVEDKIGKSKQLRDTKIAEANETKLLEEKYQATIKVANDLFDTKSWEDALVKYEEALVIKSNETHPKTRIVDINAKLAEIKAETEANSLLNKEFNDLITAADNLYKADKLEEARLKYSAALEKKSGEKHPIDRIELIISTLAKKAADKVVDEKYLVELNAAKVLFDKEEYKEALSKYNLAALIKTNEQEPKDQIQVINKILNDKKNSAQIEAEYSKFMKEGSALLANNDLTTSLDRFNKALNLKDNDADAITKIKEVKKLISDKVELELKQKEFDEFVKKGKVALSANNYQDAKLNYTKAINILPNATIDAKIKEINDLIAQNQSAVEQQKLFDDAMKKADDLFDGNEHEKALSKYETVNAIKKSQHADDRINIIKKEIADAKAKNDKDVKFNKLVTEGDVFKTDEEYQKAINSYKDALVLKTDTELNQKIAELEVLILNGKNEAQKEKDYNEMIGKAEAKFNNKEWSQAIDYYQKAKKLKENETEPDDKIALAKANIQSELDLEREKKYLANIVKADAFFNSENLDEATEYYKKALIIKNNERHPKDRLLTIQKIIDDEVNVASAKRVEGIAYETLIKEADDLLIAENYTESLKKFEIALTKKPTDFYVISQIKKVKANIDSENQENDKIAKYDKLVSEGDALMSLETWSKAKIKFESALALYNKSHPANQITICDEMMKKDSGSEAEKAYQKILTVAQTKMDDKNYEKAISLYKRALKIRPSDSKPQAKIDEINQLLKNQITTKKFDALMLEANNLFEKKKWREARVLYVEAYAIVNDSFADSQIKKIDELDGEYNMKQYNKMISKADEYFIDKNYAKSKGLYERSIKFLPNNDNTYPINRIQEIKDILNPPLAIDNGVRNLGEKVVGMTEEEMDALLANDSEQRKFDQVNSVKTITKEMSSEKTEWDIAAKESTNLTKDKTDKIAVDQKLKRTVAEVERVKVEKATIDQRKIYDKVQKENSIYTDQTRFNQKEVIENVKFEIAESIMNADIPRSEYEQEIVNINTNLNTANNFQSASQKNQSFDQKEYVNEIQTTHVTQDPNNDVARKNTEVLVIDQNIKFINERRKDNWAQEDAIMDTKTKTDLMVKEISLLNVDNDIPRQNTVDEATKIKELSNTVRSNQSKSQIDVNYDTKNYSDKVIDEIRIESVANDIPRQKMEKTTVSIYDDIAGANSSFVINQKKSTNSTKDLITEEIGIQQKAFETKDNDRAEDAGNIIVLKENLILSDKKIVNKNIDVSFATKDYADTQKDVTKQLNEKGNNSTIKNQDKTVKAVKDLKDDSKDKSNENQVKVNNTVDYITKMKDIDIKKIDVNVKNQLGADFPEGVTEEIYQKKDSHGLLLSFVVRRVVVTRGEGNVYEKTKSRYGVTSYTKNGDAVSKQVWQDNTANASLKSN